MALASAQLIDAIAALLRGVSGWADSVHTSRLWPLAEADLPAWRVQAEDETVDAHGIGFPAKQQHELEVAGAAGKWLEATAKGSSHCLSHSLSLSAALRAMAGRMARSPAPP